MYKSSFSACLLVIALILPCTVIAAGLGNLKLNSALGQPLKAEIDLVSVKHDEIDSLKAGLASREAFEQAGINYEPFYSTLKISIEPRANGKPYVKINSTQSINEPFLNILVELNWSSGRLLREYTVLLDPIEAKLPEPVAPKIRPVPTAAIAHNPSLNTVSQSTIQTDHSSTTAESVGDKSLRDASDTYGPVNQGDTLTGIVRQIFPQDANLNQLLVALYRANREAFIADNMNLLKVGKILRIPSSNEISEISAIEANQEVKMQIADWHGYRDKLASAVHEPQTEEKLTQSDSGEILTTFENEKTAIEEIPKEVLRVSSGADATDLENAADDGTLDRLRMMEEDSIARGLALKEANERVAMLEKNIENLQRLLELKDPDLAKAQIQAESTPDSRAMPETESIAVITTPSESKAEEAMLDSMLEQSSSSGLAIENTSEETVMNPIQLSETEEVSLVDQLTGNIQYVGGTLAIMLLGILSLVIRRRKKTESDAGIAEMDFDVTPSKKQHKKIASTAAAANSVPTFNSATAKDHNNEIGDVSEYSTNDSFLNKRTMEEDESHGETDFFLNENIRQDTKKSDEDPGIVDESQHMSSDRKNNSSEKKNEIDLTLDETVAETVNDSQFTNSDEPEDWSNIPVDSNNEIKFDFDNTADDNAKNPVHENGYAHDAFESTSNNSQANPSQITFEGKADLSEVTLLRTNAAEEKNTADESDNEFIIDLNDAADHIRSDESLTHLEQKSAQAIAIESSLELQADTHDTNTMIKSEEESMGNDDSSFQKDEKQRSDKPEELEFALDFPEESTVNEDSFSLDSTKSHKGLGVTNNNLDQKASPVKSSLAKDDIKDAVDANDLADNDEKTAQWHETSTKIDLARAYLEMDDKEGALEILDEVLHEGDSQQKRTARDMLADLEQK